MTPGDITVSLSRHPNRVNCRKADYQDTAEFLVSEYEPLTNILHPAGIVGNAVD